MCGITGWVDWEADLTDQSAILDAMVATLAARGPDASGTYLTKHAAIGHRRLSVVDLEGGRQPMLRYQGDHPYVITYNGELYNTAELRHELETLGYCFRTHSDTEVLLTAFLAWGVECVHRLNGIFAFGVWDEKAQSLFLARDRLGVKPLFYAERGSSLLFGSELKALLANPKIKPEIDAEGLAEVFMLGPARTPGHGIFRGIKELKPGYCAMFSRKGLSTMQYWSLQSHGHPDDFTTTVATVRRLIEDAARRQLVSDVPLCTLLSGGLDSSILSAYAALSRRSENKEPLHTFSVDYVDNDLHFQADSFQPNADGPWIKRVSDYFGTIHHNIVIDHAELAKMLVPATLSRDLPGMADVDTSLYLFCREIKKYATVALSGECADEIFGGYPWFRRPELINAGTFPWSRMLDFRSEWLSPELKARINHREYAAQCYSDALAEVPALPGEEPIAKRMREIFYLSLTRFMPTLLDRKDRMSMAFGLEVRVPFCDHRIVEYVWNVPWCMKNYQNREKGLLRLAVADVLPEDVVWRLKSPYPKTHNPAYLTTVREWALQLLSDPQSPLMPLLDVQRIKEIAHSADAVSPMPWFGQLMSRPQLFAYLIQVDTWLREYKAEIV